MTEKRGRGRPKGSKTKKAPWQKKSRFHKKPGPPKLPGTDTLRSITVSAADSFAAYGEISDDVRKLLRRVTVKIGKLSIHRSTIDDQRVYMFDALPKCTGEECMWHQRLGCGYTMNTDRDCKLLREYLNVVGTYLIARYKDLPDELDFANIGTMLLPKYIEVFRARVEVRALGPSLPTPHGGITANPLYKEISRMEKDIRAWEEYYDAKLAATEPKLIDANPRFGTSGSHAQRLMS